VTSDDGFRRQLERRKRESTLQLLFKAARLANERSVAHVRRTRPRSAGLRTAHTSLFPHIDLEGTRLTELARRVGTSKQAVAQLVDDLEAMGVVEKHPDPDDGRAKRIRFSEAGRDALLDGLEALEEVEAELAAEIGERRMLALWGALTKLLEVLEPGSARRVSTEPGQDE
jgi:DNA-binding MarR family transcriptional regulator